MDKTGLDSAVRSAHQSDELAPASITLALASCWNPFPKRLPARTSVGGLTARTLRTDGSRSTRAIAVDDVHGTAVERRVLVARDREAREDADHGRNGHGDHDAGEAEERAARE